MIADDSIANKLEAFDGDFHWSDFLITSSSVRVTTKKEGLELIALVVSDTQTLSIGKIYEYKCD